MKNVKTFSSFKEMREYLNGKTVLEPKEVKKEVKSSNEEKTTPKKSTSKKAKK